jgi:predicted nucleotidyltransferase
MLKGNQKKASEGIDEILESIKKTLRDHYGQKLTNIVLYGSYAKGNQAKESDIDIAVVMEGDFDKYDEVEQLVDLTNDISLDNDIMISILPLTMEEYFYGKYPIFENIRREGITI